MKSKNKNVINQSIPNEFSSTYINYSVEHNPNIHYNYNPAEITAMREEKIREDQENKKRKQISDCINKCKKNIIKYNQEKQNETDKINESISSVQRGKEYNENLRKQMKLKAEKKKNKNIKNKNENNVKNYEEEMIPTFSFKEQHNEDLDEFNNNMNYNINVNDNVNDENLQVKDLSQNIASQIQGNSNNSSPFITRTLVSNFYFKNSNNFENNNANNIGNNYRINPTNLINNNLYNNDNTNFHQNNLQYSGNNINTKVNKNKDIDIQQQINNNISVIQKFRQTGSLINPSDSKMNQEQFNPNYNYKEEEINNNNYIIDKNIPHPQPFITMGKMPPRNNGINSFNQNNIQQQDFNINDISSIKSGVNYSTHLNTNTSNYNSMNDSNIHYNNNNNKKNKTIGYNSPYEMNELQQKRYKKALRKLVIDRLNTKKIDIPSICSCGQLQRKIDSLLHDNKLITQDDLMNVDCANNCIYYQKPGSYHRALTDIIQSIRTLQLENGIRK